MTRADARWIPGGVERHTLRVRAAVALGSFNVAQWRAAGGVDAVEEQPGVEAN